MIYTHPFAGSDMIACGYITVQRSGNTRREINRSTGENTIEALSRTIGQKNQKGRVHNTVLLYREYKAKGRND